MIACGNLHRKSVYDSARENLHMDMLHTDHRDRPTSSLDYSLVQFGVNILGLQNDLKY